MEQEKSWSGVELEKKPWSGEEPKITPLLIPAIYIHVKIVVHVNCCLWVIVSMNPCVIELSCIKVIVSMNCHCL